MLGLKLNHVSKSGHRGRWVKVSLSYILKTGTEWSVCQQVPQEQLTVLGHQQIQCWSKNTILFQCFSAYRWFWIHIFIRWLHSEWPAWFRGTLWFIIHDNCTCYCRPPFHHILQSHYFRQTKATKTIEIYAREIYPAQSTVDVTQASVW